MSVHDFTVKSIDGKDFDLSQFKGKKMMIVNVASECGLTPQYAQMQELYNELGGEGFEIIGFPANNFGAQDPGADEDIQVFCSKNYGVTFPIMSKISVKGEDQHPLYQYLTQKAQNGLADHEMMWNFQKFLIDEKGMVARNVPPQTLPIDEEIINWIKG